MQGLFTITALSGSIELDARRRGVAAFSVTSVTSKRLRGRAVVEPGDGADVNWFTIVDGAERDFTDSKMTVQYDVDINMPDTAPAGSYQFRLDMLDANLPDEGQVVGPWVAFVAQPVPKPQPHRWPPILAWIGLTCLALAVLADLLERNSLVSVDAVLLLLALLAVGPVIHIDPQGRARYIMSIVCASVIVVVAIVMIGVAISSTAGLFGIPLKLIAAICLPLARREVLHDVLLLVTAGISFITALATFAVPGGIKLVIGIIGLVLAAIVLVRGIIGLQRHTASGD